MYRGQSGMWLWILHRLTGVGILFFLFLHIADTYLVGIGNGSYYEELVFLYHAAPFRVLEVLLVGAVLFHAINGLRIIALDFWESAYRFNKRLQTIGYAVFALTWLPSGFFMLKPIFFA